ncbi:hypothetical protein BDV96DRAFT_11820 [Lophiotrema nucula]|uniref:Glycine-rich cell wall structural protein 1 n=1 Tax=Lophiotrema nucula TaxID=690887 RepID=A0A6A5ZTX4_9PLEO|nr:hypothetical protein BDV96DRAFT_11820 [Lophiotrema nucula]
MESITNAASSVATTVSKTIWGEQNPQNPTPGNETAGQEPISGLEGKGTATEPFDQGNAETATSSSVPKLTSDNPTSSSNLTSSTPTTNESPITERKDAMDSISPNTNNASNAGATDPLQTTDKTGASGALSNPTKGSDVIPTESQHPGAAPTSGGITHQKQQGADRPGKEHGTGEEWVKTSGLAADGGDFDATKPGAGKEATRLFEDKGLTKSVPGEEPKSTGKGSFDAPSHSSDVSGEKEKVPLKEKVKQKLHIGSHKKE